LDGMNLDYQIRMHLIRRYGQYFASDLDLHCQSFSLYIRISDFLLFYFFLMNFKHFIFESHL